MTTPEIQEQAAAAQQSLWQRAPHWRNLVVAATFLSAAALALPLMTPEPEAAAPLPATQIAAVAPATIAAPPPAPLPAPSQLAQPVMPPAVAPAARTAPAQPEAAPACSITLPSQPQPMGTGIVIGFVPPRQAQQRLQNNQRMIGGPIHPAYARAPRVVVQMDGARGGRGGQIVVVPPGMSAQMGDRVAFNAIHRDPSSACAYIPPALTSNAGPAAPPAAAPPPVESINP